MTKKTTASKKWETCRCRHSQFCKPCLYLRKWNSRQGDIELIITMMIILWQVAVSWMNTTLHVPQNDTWTFVECFWWLLAPSAVNNILSHCCYSIARGTYWPLSMLDKTHLYFKYWPYHLLAGGVSWPSPQWDMIPAPRHYWERSECHEIEIS